MMFKANTLIIGRIFLNTKQFRHLIFYLLVYGISWMKTFDSAVEI